MCYLFYLLLLLLFRTHCIVLNSCRRQNTVSLGNVELVQRKLRPSQIDVDNSSNTISYLCSNAKQTYFYMGLRNGLKITINKLKCRRKCIVIIEQY